ncbi:hypothetical protein Sjap_004410 [Stephania japonica]|uniref:Uncharacterized protein n=1 Tax=Stephania japonica TaxID=461633 RepID=A0AAP0K290_9MAGN
MEVERKIAIFVVVRLLFFHSAFASDTSTPPAAPLVPASPSPIAFYEVWWLEGASLLKAGVFVIRLSNYQVITWEQRFIYNLELSLQC